MFNNNIYPRETWKHLSHMDVRVHYMVDEWVRVEMKSHWFITFGKSSHKFYKYILCIDNVSLSSQLHSWKLLSLMIINIHTYLKSMKIFCKYEGLALKVFYIKGSFDTEIWALRTAMMILVWWPDKLWCEITILSCKNFVSFCLAVFV